MAMCSPPTTLYVTMGSWQYSGAGQSGAEAKYWKTCVEWNTY